VALEARTSQVERRALSQDPLQVRLAARTDLGNECDAAHVGLLALRVARIMAEA
jgi:hypothetical protein